MVNASKSGRLRFVESFPDSLIGDERDVASDEYELDEYERLVL